MKKKILYCLITILMGLSFSCKDILEKAPLDRISDAVLWNDNRLSEAYLDYIFSQMLFMFSEVAPSPAFEGNSYHFWDMTDKIVCSDEARHSYSWFWTYASWAHGMLDQNGGFDDNWKQLYPLIRKTNEMIEQMNTSTLPEDQKQLLVCRARWERAMCYFSLVKRFGGIPLITRAQKVDEPAEDLFVPRNKEVEIYDFIINEMNAVFPKMLANERGGYPSKWAAMALKSRAALFAASIATWGEVKINGLVGIPNSEANHFWQVCYNASDSLIRLSGKSLYNRYPDDKAKNYRQLFMDENNNPESIFALQFKGTEGIGVSHGWDNFVAPQAFTAWSGSVIAVYLEMIDEYENADGTKVPFDRAKYTSGTWDPQEIFADKEPRFKASIFTENTPWQGKVVDNYSGLVLPDGSIIKSGSYNSVSAFGHSNYDNGAATGFGVLKYCDEKKIMPGNWASETDWQVFRLGEIYLNQAEACIELGKSGEALQLVNAIRERAGVAILTSIDREKVRHERKIELAFESNRYYDLKRWRTAVNDLTRQFTGLRYYLDYNSYAAGTAKYKIEVTDNVDGGYQKQFFERHYYLPITPNRISNNPNLAPENPGY